MAEVSKEVGPAPAAATPAAASMDAVLAALAVASEDDAVKTRTHIPLPIPAFSARLDDCAAYCAASMPEGATPQAALDHAVRYLFETWGLKVAKSMEDGAFSPYRVYMQQVLAQRCGTQVACGVVLDALLTRLHARGALPVRAQVGLPPDPTEQPVARLQPTPDEDQAAGADGTIRPMMAAALAHYAAGGARWLHGVDLVAECLDQLKRFFWSWEWQLGAASGFEACARGLLGASGRAGRVNAAVGVMQARGRPYGNVELSLLATERAAELTRAAHGASSPAHQLQLRDYGVQLLHTGRYAEGRAALAAHQAWLTAHPQQGASSSRASTTTGSSLPAALVEASLGGSAPVLVGELLLWEARRSLEGAYALQGGDGADASSIIDPDRDA